MSAKLFRVKCNIDVWILAEDEDEALESLTDEVVPEILSHESGYSIKEQLKSKDGTPSSMQPDDMIYGPGNADALTVSDMADELKELE